MSNSIENEVNEEEIIYRLETIRKFINKLYDEIQYACPEIQAEEMFCVLVNLISGDMFFSSKCAESCASLLKGIIENSLENFLQLEQ